MPRLLYRMATAPIRFFAAKDIFISYCRRDGSAYAEALANHFADKGFSCFIDQWHGNPEPRIPAATLRTARWSSALVVLATPGALRSESVEKEIREFVGMGMDRPIQVVVFPGIPVQTARWHDRVAGIEPATESGEQALAQGSPSDAVVGRIERSLTFRRRDRRIARAARRGIATVIVTLLVSAMLGLYATRMTRLSTAVGLAMRAEDMLANDPSQTVDALEMGARSLATTRTAWGESAVRTGLMLLPTFRGSVAVERRGKAAFGPGGVLAQWSRDDARSDASGRNVYRVALIDAARGTFVRHPVEVPGVVRNVRFTSDGSAIIAGVSAETFGPVDAIYWIPRGGGGPRRFAVGPAGAFALDPAGGSLVVANRGVERWTLGPAPVRTGEWKLPDVRALAFSPDGSRMFALRADEIRSIDARDPSAPVATLARVANTADATLLATDGHVVVVADSIRTWDLAGAAWDHAFEIGTGQAAVAGDRLAVWSQSGASFRDLAAHGADLHAGAIRAGCEGGRGRRGALLDLAVSADGRRAVLACGDGTARVVSTTDGTLLALAPVRGAVPHAVHLDERGSELRLYAVTSGMAGPRARIASWTVINGSSDRIGGGERAPLALAFALDARGGALAAVFEAAPQAYGLAVYDPLTGRERARADTTLRGWWFRVAFDAGYVALADERKVVLWRVEGDRLRLQEAFDVENAIALQFSGRNADYLAISSARGNAVEVTVLDRGPGGWRKHAPLRAGSWPMRGMPDPIVVAPVAVSETGWVAFLADTADLPGSTVRVTRGAGPPITLRHPDAVTLLRFLDSGNLLAASRSGEIWLWSFDTPQPVRRLIGRHESAVMALVPGEDDRVLAIDRDNVVRMWASGVSTGDVGLRGYMEFPINYFGIMNDDALGTKALGFSGERLVTVSQHARGLFADTWVVPRRERLREAVAGRLGRPR